MLFFGKRNKKQDLKKKTPNKKLHYTLGIELKNE
jgi:hypothetical protein